MHPAYTPTPERPPPGRPANVLLQTPRTGPVPAPCPDGHDHGRRRLLVVSLSGDPESRLAARRNRGGLPEEVAVLAAAETRSGAAASTALGPSTRQGGTDLSWSTVDSAGDVAEIGEKIDRCLSTWDDDGPRVEVCFDSLSELLEDAALPTVYRFLHVLHRRIEAADAVAHYHLYPARHRRRATSTVETLFEDVHEYDAGSGTWVEA